MGILNVNPDSFSDGGKYYDVDKAVAHAEEMVKQGADIIDIGGESTRPGYTRISDEEEIKRIVPVISEVAKHTLKAGAHIINDIWGAKADPKMAQVAADYNVPIILMHNRHEPNYTNLITDMISDLEESISIAKAAGVRDDDVLEIKRFVKMADVLVGKHLFKF